MQIQQAYEDPIRSGHTCPSPQVSPKARSRYLLRKGWSDLSNGDLLKAAERDGYELLVTTDQNLKYQQNLTERQLAIVVLLSTSWPRIRQKIDEIQTLIDTTHIGDYKEIPI